MAATSPLAGAAPGAVDAILRSAELISPLADSANAPRNTTLAAPGASFITSKAPIVVTLATTSRLNRE
jgi:hypothetical protein